jgi:hypothetical protein
VVWKRCSQSGVGSPRINQGPYCGVPKNAKSLVFWEVPAEREECPSPLKFAADHFQAATVVSDDTPTDVPAIPKRVVFGQRHLDGVHGHRVIAQNGLSFCFWQQALRKLLRQSLYPRYGRLCL